MIGWDSATADPAPTLLFNFPVHKPMPSMTSFPPPIPICNWACYLFVSCTGLYCMPLSEVATGMSEKLSAIASELMYSSQLYRMHWL